MKKKQAELEARISRERVETLKKEKEVASLVSMLEGEDRERARLAKDLHDGLGGMLSPIRMRFDQIQKINAQPVGSNDYTEALDLIDQTSQEARRISHNLMPGSLALFELKAALEELSRNIEASTKIKVSLQVLDLENELSPKIQKNVYRIVQEFSNNTIRYAKASEMIIQLSESEKELHITLEDNGIGFDTEKKSEGLGLRSIKSRVDHLNFEIDILSAPGEGTSFQIIIPIA